MESSEALYCRYGVRAAMPGFIARELCRRQGVELRLEGPSGVVVMMEGGLRFKPVDMPRYQAASKIFKDTVSLYGPMKMLSLDEVVVVVVVGVG